MSTVVDRGLDYSTGSVRTRISWGAIAAGAAVAMAIYTLLMSLGLAVGMSVGDDATARSLGMGAGIWGFIALSIALFAGGWVTTQVTVGENRTEAVLYGVVLWATTSTLLLWLAANGVRAGMETAMAMQSMTNGNHATSTMDADRTAQDRTADLASQNRQPDAQRTREAGREGAWWAFAGILLSMIASIAGALVGPVELTIRRDSRYPREHQNVETQ